MRSVLSGAICAAAGIASLTLVSGANAQTPIPLGTTVFVPLTTGQFANKTFLFSSSSAYSFSNVGQGVIGTLVSEVYQNNGFGFDGVTSKALDFFYQLNVTSVTGGDQAASFGVSSFAGSSLQVAETGSNTGDTGGSFSSSVATDGGLGTTARHSSSGNNGAGMLFTFGTSIGAGTSSDIFEVRTNAISSTTNGGASVSSGSGSAGNTTSNALTPLANGSIGTAPEPGSLALVIPGVLGIVGFARRRKA